jgi:hypothetical protein
MIPLVQEFDRASGEAIMNQCSKTIREENITSPPEALMYYVYEPSLINQTLFSFILIVVLNHSHLNSNIIL